MISDEMRETKRKQKASKERQKIAKKGRQEVNENIVGKGKGKVTEDKEQVGNV